MKATLGIFMVLCGQANAATLLLTTEEAPPFNFSLDQGKTIVGSSTDTVREMLRRAKVDYRIEIYPWARAYNIAATTPDTCLFSTTRTEDREKLFAWVGPIGSNEWVFFARADSKITLKSFDDARAYAVGGYYGDATSNFLHAKKFNVIDAYSDEQLIQVLQRGKIDLWASGRKTGLAQAKKNGIAVKPLLSFNKVQLYLACHKSLDADVANALNRSLQTMVQDGTLSRLDQKYAP